MNSEKELDQYLKSKLDRIESPEFNENLFSDISI